jgi:hypothetical protein
VKHKRFLAIPAVVIVLSLAGVGVASATSSTTTPKPTGAVAVAATMPGSTTSCTEGETYCCPGSSNPNTACSGTAVLTLTTGDWVLGGDAPEAVDCQPYILSGIGTIETWSEANYAGDVEGGALFGLVETNAPDQVTWICYNFNGQSELVVATAKQVTLQS